jgi:phospholipase C
MAAQATVPQQPTFPPRTVGAFDHMLGHLALTDARVDGLSTPHCMPVNPTAPGGSKTVCTQFDAIDGGPVDPPHDFDSITKQVFGFAKPMGDKTSPELMNGFAWTAPDAQVDFVLSAFNASTLPVLSALATEFALFDAWHVSVPTCTNPNREFMMSGQSNGYTVNSFPDAGFPQETHFTFLEKRGFSCWYNACCFRTTFHLTTRFPPYFPPFSPLHLSSLAGKIYYSE